MFYKLQSQVDILANAELSDWDELSDVNLKPNTKEGLPKELKKKPVKTSKEAESKSPDSLHFDASQGVLTLDNDLIVATGFGGDAILGAEVVLPSFAFAGFTPDFGDAIFFTDEEFEVEVVGGAERWLLAGIDMLRYDFDENLFWGEFFGLRLSGVAPSSPLFDASLSTANSAWIAELASILDPGSLLYDGQSSVRLRITRDADFWALTNALTVSASIGFSNSVGTRKASAPGSLAALLLAVVVLVAAREMKQRCCGIRAGCVSPKPRPIRSHRPTYQQAWSAGLLPVACDLT